VLEPVSILYLYTKLFIGTIRPYSTGTGTFLVKRAVPVPVPVLHVYTGTIIISVHLALSSPGVSQIRAAGFHKRLCQWKK
jgi:hypothetical protein